MVVTHMLPPPRLTILGRPPGLMPPGPHVLPLRLIILARHPGLMQTGPRLAGLTGKEILRGRGAVAAQARPGAPDGQAVAARPPRGPGPGRSPGMVGSKGEPGMGMDLA